MLRALLVALALALLPGCADDMLDPWEAVPQRADAAAAARDADLVDPSGSAWWSTIMVQGVFDLGLGWIVVTAAARALRHRVRARAARTVAPVGPLRDGPSVLSGVVEIAQGETDAPIAVEVLQVTSYRIGGKGWREAGRRIVARPFYLRVDANLRVRVEPDDEVDVHTVPGRVERIDVGGRKHVAEIGAGERVRVTGVLVGVARHDAAGVYRQGSETPTLRPPSDGPMSIEAEALAGHEFHQARFHLRWALLAAILFVVAGGLIAPRYHLLALTGVRVTATATAIRIRHELGNTVKRHGTVYKAGYYIQHYELSAKATLPDGRVVSFVDECSPELHGCLRAGGCHEIPYVVSTVAPSQHQMGTRPDLGWAPSLLLAVVSLAACTLYHNRRALRTLEGRLDERDDGRSQLDDREAR